MFFAAGLCLGTGVGFAMVWSWSRARMAQLTERQAQTERSLAEEQSRGKLALVEQKETFERVLQEMKLTEEKLKESFTTVATSVLDRNTLRFKESAEKDLRQIKTEGTADLDSRVKVFSTAVEDLKGRLKDAGEKIAGFERERVDTYARLEKQMQQLNEQEKKLISETDRLKSALTTSNSVRGRWGELVLRNILQSSELMQHIDFHEQEGSRNSEGDDLKPDFVLRLPNAGQYLVIDAKTSLYESYLEAEHSKTDSERRQVHQEFSKRLRKRVLELSSKEYQKNVSASVPYVIMFVPGEAAIRAAFDSDPDIFQFAMDRKVFIASPATIIPLIMLIANAWRQFKMSSQATELGKVVEQIGDRLQLFVDRLGRVQRGLEAATKSWNEAIDKSWNGQQSVIRAIDKARELGGQIPELAALEGVHVAPRSIGDRNIRVIEESVTVVEVAVGSEPSL